MLTLTIDQIGILDELRKRNENMVIYPFESDEKGKCIFVSDER